jgi:hypothetical protein
MIRKEELRLGSLVLMKEAFGYDEWELYVCKLSEDELSLANAHDIYTGVKWSNVEPLTIFYWHMEKAGFTRITKEIYTFAGWQYDCETKIATWRENTFQVNYVHQLQNLVLAISGIHLDFSGED